MSRSDPPQRRACRFAALPLVAALLIAAGCSSQADEVCEDIGDCAHRGDSDWIGACQSETKALRSEAADANCAAAFDQYFSCADSAYTCTGATAAFPGCEERHAALDACLSQATAGTSCAALAVAEASCSPLPGDGGAADSTGAALPPACTASRDCQANCYLDNVANACAPGVEELEALTACASACPL